MKRRNCCVAVLLGGAFLAGAGSAGAQDWNQWRGPNRDGKAAGFTAPAQWPAELTQVWKATVGAGDATPAVVGDKVYVFGRQGGDEVTTCLNAADGKVVWEEKNPVAAISGPDARGHAGPRSSPAVADGKVVTLGVTGVLSCLDAASGKLVWRKDLYPGAWPQFHTSSSPLIVDGMAIAQVGGANNGGIVALDLATGNPKWQWTAEGPDYGSPVVATLAGTRQIVTLTAKSLVGVGLADGKLLWSVPSVPARMSYNCCTPIIDGQNVIFSGAGQPLKAIAVSKEGDACAAKEAWSNPDNIAVQFSSPILKDGFVYGLSNRGNLFCVNAKTGQTAWTDATTRGGRGGYGPLVDAGAVIVVLPTGSELTAFKPSDKGFEEVGKSKVGDSYAFPVLMGKKVLVHDGESLTMFALP